MSHYYEFDPNLQSDPKQVYYNYRGEQLIFKSDSGVFSKLRVDFGTNLLLNSLNESDLLGNKVLDLGCGYGVVGLSIAKRYRSSFVHLVDINKRALELTAFNKLENKLENVLVYESDVYKTVKEQFKTIITNPPIRAGKKVVHEMVLGGYAYLESPGCLYVVIQKKQGAASLSKQMEEVFDEVLLVGKKSGYYVFQGRKKNNNSS